MKTEAQKARKAAAEARAKAHKAKGEAAWEASNKILEVIPLGQPILVGHYSEKRHRRDLSRADKLAHKAMDELQEAKRADSSGVGRAIMADDPQAIEALKEKLVALEKKRDLYKEANRVYAQRGRAALIQVVGVEEAARAIQNMTFGRNSRPYPTYATSNLTNEIARIRQRITHLEELKAAPVKEDVQGDGWTVEEDNDAVRLRVRFEERISKEDCSVMKKNGFRWAPSEGAWQRQLSVRARYAAEQALSQITGKPISLT